MATAIQMPALSPTMKEGTITRWLKKEGDSVSSGEAVAECETDKANLEIEAYDEGVLLKIAVPEGHSAKVGAPIAYLGRKGEKVEAPPAAVPEIEAPPAKPPPTPRVEERPPVTGRLRASPLARKMARERGLDLAGIQGTGPQGRIVKRDIDAAARLAPAGAPPLAAPLAGRRAPDVLPMSSMRRVIAQRLAEVKPGIPHFYLTVDVDMEAALTIREEARALQARVSVNDIVIKAAAVALRRTPGMNVSLQDERLLQFHNVDVSFAVAIDEGLITPVIQDADVKGLVAIAAETRELAARARKRTLRPEEYSGGSISVSNLGMYGVEQFVAVINPPQAAILAVGAVVDRPVVLEGQIAARKRMSVTLSGDHRVIDGALGAQYLQELKSLLEHPMRLLL